MKYTIKHLASIAIALVVATGVSAQNTLNSSYFMEKMTKRNQLNPALKTPNNYVSMPVLSNFYLGVNSNLGLGTFLYPRDNKLVTFLHESVPADEFLGKLANDNALELDLGLDIISGSGLGVDRTPSTSPSRATPAPTCPKSCSSSSKPDKNRPV